MLLTLVLGFALDLCNNKDIILILGYNYNIYNRALNDRTMRLYQLYTVGGLLLHVHLRTYNNS